MFIYYILILHRKLTLFSKKLKCLSLWLKKFCYSMFQHVVDLPSFIPEQLQNCFDIVFFSLPLCFHTSLCPKVRKEDKYKEMT